VYNIGKIRELDSGRIRKAKLARSAFTFAVSVAVKHLPPQLSFFMPCVGKNPCPSRYWLGENIETVTRPDFFAPLNR
jgi:hypothetical protein